MIHLQAPTPPLSLPVSYYLLFNFFFLAISSLITHDNSWARIMKTLHSTRQLQEKREDKNCFFRFFWEVKERTLLSCHYSKGECFISPRDLLEIWLNDVSGLSRDISSLVGMFDGPFDLPKKKATIIVYVRFWPLICYLPTLFSFLQFTATMCVYSKSKE